MRSKNRASPAPARHPVVPAGIGLRWIWHYSALCALRDRLRGEIGRHSQEATESSGPGGDPGDDAAIEFEHEAALKLLESEENALMEIEAAIERLHGGTYGVCEATGRRIPDARLRAIPWCRYVVDEQARQEAARRQLAPAKFLP